MLNPTEAPDTIGNYSKPVRLAILQSAIEHENIVNSQANIVLIDRDELVSHLQTLPPGRQRLLISHGGHYMAADAFNQEGAKSCILLDAANDYRCQAVMTDFENQGFTVLMATSLSEAVERNLQTDTSSCSMFALDHCVQLAHAPDDLHTELLARVTKENMGGFTWDSFPPNLFWNAQTSSFIQTYMTTHPEQADQVMPNGLSMRQYIAQGTSAATGLNNSIDIHVFNNAHTIYLAMEAAQRADQAYQAQIVKSEIVAAMNKSIQASESTGWIMPGKSGKLTRLKDIRDNFAQSPTVDPLNSPFIQEFNTVAGEARFAIKAASGKMFESEMTVIRTKHTADGDKKAEGKDDSLPDHSTNRYS